MHHHVCPCSTVPGAFRGPQALRMRVTGMVCAACSGAVEGALKAQPGVSRAAVALASGEVEVTFDSALNTAVGVG